MVLERRRPRSSARFCTSARTTTSGPRKIADYLKRFTMLSASLARPCTRILLHGIGMNRLPANQKHRQHSKRWQRYEKAAARASVADGREVPRAIPGTRKRLYQFTAIDDCTRIRVLKVYDACNQRTAIRSSTKSFGGCRSASTSCRPTTAPSFSPNFTGTGGLDIRHVVHPPAHARTSTARSNGHTASMTRSSTSCSTRTASPTTSTCSTRSCASGRTTTITTGRTALWTDRPRTSDYWQKRELTVSPKS